MEKKVSIKLGSVIILSSLLFVSMLTPMTTVGNNIESFKNNMLVRNYNYDNYSLSETSYKEQQTHEKHSNSDNIVESENKYNIGGSIQSLGGPADSAWPMICHDLRHTARSQYTPDNSGIEKWRYRTKDCIEASPVIGEDGTIYVGDLDRLLYAINPDGTLKWKYGVGGWIYLSAPAVAEDGTVYVTSWDAKLHAVYPNGTGKWKFDARANICSSPAISEDGTIYFGSLWSLGSGGKIHAVNPNGTEKWRYQTGDQIMSYPAIGVDGTIYIGSSDNFLYAMNPNGTLKWRYKTGDEIQGHPSIADDGTIYVPSFDDYLHALYPNGTLRWKAKLSAGSDSGVAIAQDGTLYIGSDKLYAIFPNGTMKWSVNLAGFMDDSSPAISADGNIYICAGQSLVAVDPNGSELWRKKLGKLEGSPAIGKDGTIYVGSGQDGFGYLHAFGAPCFTAEAHGPYYGLTGEPVQFEGDAYKGVKPYSWLWDFGDGHTSYEQNPSHIYTKDNNFTVTLTVSDIEGNVTDDASWAWVQDGNVPPDKPTIEGPIKGKPEEILYYDFLSSDPEGAPIWYYIDWDFGSSSGWLGPYKSGTEIEANHWWPLGTFTIRCKAKDPYGEESEWGELKVIIPKNKATYNPFFLNLLERFPLLTRLLSI
jgi:outer membrane protein assembly factor BamB